MVECNFSDPAREAEWNTWYSDHLKVLLSVPGLNTAQRFLALAPAPTRYFAMYTVDSPEVFVSEGYKGIRGGRFNDTWQPYIRDWRRNLFDGLDQALAVPEGSCLVSVNDATGEADVPGVTLAWLRAVDLDKSTNYRGIAVVDLTKAEELVSDMRPGIGVYKRLTPQRTV